MLEIAQAIIVICLVIVGPFLIIWMLDRRVKKKGPLFSGPTTPFQRILAFILGCAFAAAFIWELFNSTRISFLWPILAVALLGYSLGARSLLDKFQGDSSFGKSVNEKSDIEVSNEEETSKNPFKPR